MSGDVQPRKRKDKKKKRDDDESSHGVHITKMGSDDVHLHVQHDHGTGGHWCAKVIFFSLMTILLGLVALIILENRGISDLDTPLSESRFSNYFDGWVEEHRPDEHGHDDHGTVQTSDEHDHDEPYEEEEDHTGEDDEGEEATAEDEDGDNDEHEDDDEEGEDEEITAETATAEEDDDDNNNDNDDDEDADNDDEDVDNDEEDADNDEDDDQITQEEATAEDADDDEENDDNEEEVTAETATAEEDDDNDNNDDDEDADNDEEDDQKTQEEATAEDADDDDNDINNDDDEDDDGPKTVEDDDDDEDEDADNDNDADSNVVDNDAEEWLILQEKERQQAAESNIDEKSAEQDDDDKADDSTYSWASSLAGKIGVGVALVFVARFLLLRKSPNASDEPSPEIIMRRRLTIAAPEDIFPDDELPPPFTDDDEYVEEEVIIEEEIEYVEDDETIEQDDQQDDEQDDEPDEDVRAYVPETFEQLNAMYRPSTNEESRMKSTPSPQPQTQLTPEPQPVLKPIAPISQRFKERWEEPPKVINTTGSDSIRRATAPVFTAPPPPPLHEAKIRHATPPLEDTKAPQSGASISKNNIQTPPAHVAPTYGTPDEIHSEASRRVSQQESQLNKQEVAHDLDYQPDDEDIDYDDDEYVNEEESSLDGDDEEDEEISDVDDSELMNRLEAKYGKIQSKEYESDEDPEDPTWTQIKPKENVGGGGPQAHDDDDFDSFERELREANEELMRENYIAAYKAFTRMCQRYPDQPSVFLGKAQSLDKLAEQQRSNKLLHEAIDSYKRYLAFDFIIVDDKAFRLAAERCIERMRFIGNHVQALPIHDQLIKRFPLEPSPRNQLAVTQLFRNHLTDAKGILQETLRRWPNNGFAQVHYGFVLKQLEQDYENAVVYLRQGINSNEPGTQDGRFYFNLGDALQRLGRQAEALEVYERGAKLKLFPSMYQRSLYNEPNLRAQPFWSKKETTYANFLHKLEQNWQAIRDEGLSLLSRKGYFENESENLRDHGEWQQYELFARGQRQQKNCQKAPITCGVIQEFSAASSCRRGQVKFSVLHPNTHVWPHCGPTNCRLRAHLGLVVPEGTQLRVTDQYRSWVEGEFLIFDDSFEHEVWHNGTSLRLVLIVDIWHPDLTERQRHTLTPI